MKKTSQSSAEWESAPLNHEQERIRDWLKQVRFRKATFGGVSEADVWKKIGELNTMYEAALAAERARYDALLRERVNLVAHQVAKRVQEEMSTRQGSGADETTF